MLGAWYNFELWIHWLVVPLATLFAHLPLFLPLLMLLLLLCDRQVVLIIVSSRCLVYLLNIDTTALDSDGPSMLDSHFTNVALGRRRLLLLLSLCGLGLLLWKSHRGVPIDHLYCIQKLNASLLAKKCRTDGMNTDHRGNRLRLLILLLHRLLFFLNRLLLDLRWSRLL